MSLFQRAHDILSAKANKALDAAEKPDEMLDLSYEQMLDQITRVRRGLVDIAAARKQIELQQQQLQHTVDHLNDQAKAALAQGREDLAREALSRKAAAQQQIDGLQSQQQELADQEQKLEQEPRRPAGPGQQVPQPEGSPQGPVHRRGRADLDQ